MSGRLRRADDLANLCGLHPTFPGGLAVKNPPAMQEMQVPSLGQEDPPEKETATHSSILAGKIPWTEEPGRLQFTGWQRVGTRLSAHAKVSICKDVEKNQCIHFRDILWLEGTQQSTSDPCLLSQRRL